MPPSCRLAQAEVQGAPVGRERGDVAWLCHPAVAITEGTVSGRLCVPVPDATPRDVSSPFLLFLSKNGARQPLPSAHAQFPSSDSEASELEGTH